MNYLQLILAFIICASLAYLSHRRGFTVGFLDGLAVGRAETQQLKYSEGHEEGLHEGRLKERMEIATSNRKVYEQGYNDALAAVQAMNYTAMIQEAEQHLSA